MIVRLTRYEQIMAGEVGLRRQLAAVFNGLEDKHGCDGSDGFTLHIEGAAGEMAVAKTLGIYWGGSVDTFKECDVGALQVRTRSRHSYDLILRPDDSDTERFVHVTGRLPVFRIHGWVFGAEGKQPQWLQTYGERPAAYFVPKSELRPLGELRPSLISSR